MEWACGRGIDHDKSKQGQPSRRSRCRLRPDRPPGGPRPGHRVRRRRGGRGRRLEDHPRAGRGHPQREPPGPAGRRRRRHPDRSGRHPGLPQRRPRGVPRRPRRGRRERRSRAQLQERRRLQRPPDAVVGAEPPAQVRQRPLRAGAGLVRPGARSDGCVSRQQRRCLPAQRPALRPGLPGRGQVQGHRHLRHLLLWPLRARPVAAAPARRPAGHRLGGGDSLPGHQRHQPGRRGLGDDHRRPGRQRREASGQPGLRQRGSPGAA